MADDHPKKKENGGVSIRVAIRCRPFSEPSPLGVSVIQRGETGGEVAIRASEAGRGGRYAFSYAWWSAYGYERYCELGPVREAAP